MELYHQLERFRSPGGASAQWPTTDAVVHMHWTARCDGRVRIYRALCSSLCRQTLAAAADTAAAAAADDDDDDDAVHVFNCQLLFAYT